MLLQYGRGFSPPAFVASSSSFSSPSSARGIDAPQRRSFVATVGETRSELSSGRPRFRRLGERSLANARSCSPQEVHKDASGLCGGSSGCSISGAELGSSFSCCLRARNNTDRICVDEQQWNRDLAEARRLRFGSQKVHPGARWRLRRMPARAAALRRHGSVTVVKKCRSSCKGFLVNAFESKPKRGWFKELLFQPIEDRIDEEDSRVEEETEQDSNTNGAFKSFDKPEDDKFESEDVGDIDDVNKRIIMPADDGKKFTARKRNRDASTKKDVRKFEETGETSDSSRGWQDWLDDTWGDDYTGSVGAKDGGWFQPQPDWERGGLPRDPPTKPERGMRRNMKEILFRFFEREEEVEEDLLFEQRVFRYTSQSTAKFVACLILVPWLVDFVVHDFVMVPFLARYVEVVPLAAKVLDVRESQKLQMIEHLKLERQRVRFQAEIGQAPPLSDQELAEHIRHEALHLREELRLENRQAFANIWSDLVAGFTVLLLLVLNSKQVAIMRMTGDRLVTNVSDTGKAFIIILLSDIFLGYHSELGWETVIEMVLDHYGLQADQASIYIFVAIVPVTIDACFKLWVFRYLSRLSASAAATFREMQRH
ncbi:unnamed protein product [Sphagnum compactum]